jgi:glycerol-3-phosphate dehydrogenase subunit C
MKKEWPVYLGTPEAAEVAAATVDIMEFLEQLRRNKQLNGDFKRGFGRVVYHAACHLRAQKIAYPGARLLSRLPDTDVRIVERCSAVDGTWGMKARFYAEGVRYARRLGQEVREHSEDADDVLVVTDCSLAGLRIKHQTGMFPTHPIVALARAYQEPDDRAREEE